GALRAALGGRAEGARRPRAAGRPGADDGGGGRDRPRPRGARRAGAPHRPGAGPPVTLPRSAHPAPAHAFARVATPWRASCDDVVREFPRRGARVPAFWRADVTSVAVDRSCTGAGHG